MTLARVGAIVAVVMMVIGCLCLCFSFASYLYLSSRNASYISAEGVVIELVKKDRNSRIFYCPVFSFNDRNGVARTIYSTSGSYPPINQVGDKIDVIYDPQTPNNALIDRFFVIWIVPLATGIIGGINLFMGVSLLVIVKIVRKVRYPMGKEKRAGVLSDDSQSHGSVSTLK